MTGSQSKVSVNLAQRMRDMVSLCEKNAYPHGDDYSLADSRAGDLMWEAATALDEAEKVLALISGTIHNYAIPGYHMPAPMLLNIQSLARRGLKHVRGLSSRAI